MKKVLFGFFVSPLFIAFVVFVSVVLAQEAKNKWVEAGINPLMTESISGWGYDQESEREYYMNNCRNPSNPRPIPAEYAVVFEAASERFGDVPTILYLQNESPLAAPVIGPEVVVRREDFPEKLFDYPPFPVGTSPRAIAKAITEYDG